MELELHLRESICEHSNRQYGAAVNVPDPQTSRLYEGEHMYLSLRCQVQCTPSDTVSPLLVPFPQFNVAPTASPRAPLTLQEITGRAVGGTVGAPLGGAEGICGEALGVPVGEWTGLLDG